MALVVTSLSSYITFFLSTVLSTILIFLIVLFYSLISVFFTYLISLTILSTGLFTIFFTITIFLTSFVTGRITTFLSWIFFTMYRIYGVIYFTFCRIVSFTILLTGLNTVFLLVYGTWRHTVFLTVRF